MRLRRPFHMTRITSTQMLQIATRIKIYIQGRISQLKTKIDAAQTTANTAKNTAEAASTAASDAQSTANTAKSIAEEAKTAAATVAKVWSGTLAQYNSLGNKDQSVIYLILES